MISTGLPDISCHYEEVIEPTIKVVFVHHDMAQMDALIQLLNNHPEASDFDFVRSEKHLYEILPKNSGKGLAIKKLAELLETDKTVAIGDFYNDISMFEEAKVGIAVSNACKEAIDCADYVTVSNEESAIAKVIFDIEKGNIEV